MTNTYLGVSDFSGGVGNTEKIKRHFGPLAAQTDVTIVCLESGPDIENIKYLVAPSVGFRPLDLLLLFTVALVEAARNDYDGVVSISLIPYGSFSLVIGRLYGVPVHLGVIGGDLDVHAQASYNSVVKALFRKFDAISVPGSEHEHQLEQIGIPPERIVVLSNAIDTETYIPDDTTPIEYDYIWVGRLTAEKDPLVFIRTIAELSQQGHDPRAVMLGHGPLLPTVREQLQAHGLTDQIELPGWVDDPVDYYQKSKIFVLTSERDALPLTLLEAMSIGLACVVPDVGNVRDVVTDGETGIIVPTRDAKSFAAEIQQLQTDTDRYERIVTNASAVGSEFSYECAQEDWSEILRTLHTT